MQASVSKNIPKICTWYSRIIEMGNFKGNLVKNIWKHNLEPMGETLCFDLHILVHYSKQGVIIAKHKT